MTFKQMWDRSWRQYTKPLRFSLLAIIFLPLTIVAVLLLFAVILVVGVTAATTSAYREFK